MKEFLIIAGLFFAGVNINVAQNIRNISKSDLAVLLNNPSDKLHVINFWATWCAPCIKELPEFQKTVYESDSSRVDFLFISLDFPSEAVKRVNTFMKKNNYTFNVALMTEIDYNSWIDLVDQEWQGNIPATLIYNRARRIHYFIAEPLEKLKLTNAINSFLIN